MGGRWGCGFGSFGRAGEVKYESYVMVEDGRGMERWWEWGDVRG